MAKKIDYKIYERNCKSKNKRGVLRSFSSLVNHPEELGIIKNAGINNKLLLSVSVDITQVEALISFFKERGFKTFGDDYYYLECAYNDYLFVEGFKGRISSEKLKEMQMELIDRKTREPMFIEEENDNAKFYLLPYNDECNSVYSFLEKYKDEIISFAKVDDVTIVMNPIGYSNQINGFIAFNFYDLDEKEEGKEVEVDFVSGFNVAVDFNKPVTIYSSALYLSALGSNYKELDKLKLGLYADNYR